MIKYKLSIIATAIVFLVLGTACFLQHATHKNNTHLQGSLVFAKTYDQGHKINKIELVSANNKLVLEQKDSYWLVKDRGGYYADFSRIHQLLLMLNESVYKLMLPYDDKILYEKQLNNPQENKQNSGVLVQTYVDNELLDAIIIGSEWDKGQYFFARKTNENSIWIISNVPSLSFDNWLLSPILSIPENVIEHIEIGNRHLERAAKDETFNNEEGTDIKPLIDFLSNIKAVDAHYLQPEGLKDPSKKITITTFFGLRFEICVFENNEKTWINIKLATTSLPKAAVLEFIAKNRFLYDDWYFLLPQNQADIIKNL